MATPPVAKEPVVSMSCRAEYRLERSDSAVTAIAEEGCVEREERWHASAAKRRLPSEGKDLPIGCWLFRLERAKKCPRNLARGVP